MKVKPLGDRLLVKPEEGERITKGGIHIPDTAKEKPHAGKVVAVGTLKDIQLKEGDRIIYESYAGTEITIENEKHLLLNAKDVLAKME